jgi:glutathione S-transferase
MYSGTVRGMNGHVRLWHLPTSHFSEKVRWALEHKRIAHTRRTPLIVPHFVLAGALTRGAVRTFPVAELPTGVVGDSTAIIAALEQQFPERPLYPEDPVERARALEAEDWFDENLGRDVRIVALHAVTHDPPRLAQLSSRHAPAFMKPFPDAWAQAFAASIRKRYRLEEPGRVEAARAGIARAFDELERRLGGGEHLAAGTFTVADLTAASHFYWLIQPPEGPHVVDRVPAGLDELMTQFAERDGYRWVLETYRRHRRVSDAAPASARARPALAVSG